MVRWRRPIPPNITFKDLLTHRAGLTYGDFHRGPIAERYREALGGDIDSPVAPDDWIARLAQLPLISQPGAMMSYGRATDLLGLLIARIEGESLKGCPLKRRIFDPLGMKDTSFLVPHDKRDRRAAAYRFNDEGRLIKRTTWSGVVVVERPEDMAYESGAAGLWSTVDDYLRFARMFLRDGSVDGVHLLSREMLADRAGQFLAPPTHPNQILDRPRASARAIPDGCAGPPSVGWSSAIDAFQKLAAPSQPGRFV